MIKDDGNLSKVGKQSSLNINFGPLCAWQFALLAGVAHFKPN
jgi:hypothetical protein